MINKCIFLPSFSSYLLITIFIELSPLSDTTSPHQVILVQTQAQTLPHGLWTFWCQKPSWLSSCFFFWSGSLTVSLRSATVFIIMAMWRPTNIAPRSRRCETRLSGYWATSSPSMSLTSSRFLSLFLQKYNPISENTRQTQRECDDVAIWNLMSTTCLQLGQWQ